MLRTGLLSIVLLALPVLAVAGDLVMVAHPSISQHHTSRNFARTIFGMRAQQWPDGSSIRVFVLPDNHQLHAAFSKEVLNLFPHQLRTAWDRQVYSGTGQAPSEVRSEEEMMSRIASTPGAIGYVSRNNVNEYKVRIVEVRP